jgi:hypothetical protein
MVPASGAGNAATMARLQIFAVFGAPIVSRAFTTNDADSLRYRDKVLGKSTVVDFGLDRSNGRENFLWQRLPSKGFFAKSRLLRLGQIDEDIVLVHRSRLEMIVLVRGSRS